MNKLEKWLLISFAAALAAVGAVWLLSRRGAEGAEVQLRTVLPGHTGRVISLAFFPDGKTIVSAGMDDHSIHLWDAESGQLLFQIKTVPIGSVAVSPNGQKVFVGGRGGDYRLWDVSTGELKTLVSSPQTGYTGVEFSPNGQTVAALIGSPSRSISIWDVKTGDRILTTNGISFMYSPDGKQFASSSMDGAVKVWNAETGALIHTLRGHGGKANLAAFSPDGKRIVSAGDDNTVKIWNADNGSLIHTLKEHRGKVRGAAYSPDGKTISSVGEYDVKIWDAETAVQIHTINEQINFYLLHLFSPGGKYIVKSVPNAVKIWDAATGEPLYTLRHSSEHIYRIAHSPDGSATEGTIAAADEKGEILIWNLNDAAP
ncbi:MAG: WD40 repeat domain-containing protein [Candidatus Poribacteria bacterium]|nr:WD40 repeat domain-containing protein [Candidatus Poribacteria bacterium]